MKEISQDSAIAEKESAYLRALLVKELPGLVRCSAYDGHDNFPD